VGREIPWEDRELESYISKPKNGKDCWQATRIEVKKDSLKDFRRSMVVVTPRF
jgi:hypothetical protein